MVGSHCRSDQLDRPDRPNSPTTLDQLPYTTFSRPLLDRTRPHTITHDSSTTSTRQPPHLYSIIPTLTRCILDQLDLYSISTRPDRPDRTGVMGYWSNRGRLDLVLIGNFFIPTKLDLYTIVKKRFPINSTSNQPISNHFPMASRVLGFSIST